MSHSSTQTSASYFPKAPELCRDELLHELFERSAAAQEGDIALACGEERMTYGEVEQRAHGAQIPFGIFYSEGILKIIAQHDHTAPGATQGFMRG